MNNNIQRLEFAFQFAQEHRPAVGGFPFLAECLRLAGVQKNIWVLPACQSTYFFADGSLVNTLPSLIGSMVEIPRFDESLLQATIDADKNGKTTFPEFLQAIWQAGVVEYTVDFDERVVVYYGSNDEIYSEEYDLVKVDGLKGII